ncbi:hypothetical protein ACTXT7_012540 [Hymenolepis weldensis]
MVLVLADVNGKRERKRKKSKDVRTKHIYVEHMKIRDVAVINMGIYKVRGHKIGTHQCTFSEMDDQSHWLILVNKRSSKVRVYCKSRIGLPSTNLDVRKAGRLAKSQPGIAKNVFYRHLALPPCLSEDASRSNQATPQSICTAATGEGNSVLDF